jgi:hypothetical protein
MRNFNRASMHRFHPLMRRYSGVYDHFCKCACDMCCYDVDAHLDGASKLISVARVPSEDI